MDRIGNEIIRWTMKVGEISKSEQERMLKWHGHVVRRDEEYVGKSDDDRCGGEDKERQGRPKQR